MKGATKIFRIFNIDIKLHYSWWFIFALLAYALAVDFFPQNFPDLSTQTYWIMGIVSSFLLFASVLGHELTHSLVAKSRKIEVESITLFFFGGVASLPSEDMKPWTEFWMALSGPLFSMVLAFVLYLFFLQSLPVYVGAIFFYLYNLNFILAIFNLLPGYPLDGGRVFRALLMMHYKDLRKATYIASKGGKFLGGLMVIFGLLGIFMGTFSGLWFVFLGGFLWFIAGMSYEQVIIKGVLSKMKATKMMKKKYIKLDPKMTFEKVIKKHHAEEQQSFIVEKGGKFLGILDLQKIGRVKGSIGQVLVSSLMVPAAKIKTIDEKEHAYLAFRKMLQQNFGRLPILRNSKIIGVVNKKTLMHYLVMRLKYGVKV